MLNKEYDKFNTVKSIIQSVTNEIIILLIKNQNINYISTPQHRLKSIIYKLKICCGFVKYIENINIYIVYISLSNDIFLTIAILCLHFFVLLYVSPYINFI